MLNSKPQATALKTTNTKSFIQISSRFALLSFYHEKRSRLHDSLLLIFEYIQLLSLALLLIPSLYNDSGIGDKPIFYDTVYAAKMLNPSYLLSFQGSDSLSKTALLLVFAVTMIKYLLFAYAFMTAAYHQKGWTSLNKVWRWVFKVQGRVIFYFTASFWLNTYKNVEAEKFDFFGLDQAVINSICIVLILIDFAFSVFLQVMNASVLPSKSFLCSKTNHVEATTLCQKFIIIILLIVIPDDSESAQWVLTAVNIFISLYRCAKFYGVLPMYNLKALFLQNYLTMIEFSLTLASFLQVIVHESGKDGANIGFTIVVWTIFILLSAKISHEILHRIIFELAANSVSSSPQILVHKISAIKQLRKPQRMYSEYNQKFKFSELLNKTINATLSMAMSLDSNFPQDIELDIHSKKSTNRMYLHFLETLMAKFPRDKFLKLYTARFYANKSKLYGKAMKILVELQQEGWSRTSLNALLVIYEIENLIKSEYEDGQGKSEMDLSTYVRSQDLVNHIKEKMSKQADIQVVLYKEMLEEFPDLGKIFNSALSADKIRQSLDKKIKIMLRNIPEYFIEPILYCAHYSLGVNHSLHEYSEFVKLYTKKHQRYEKYFKESDLICENFYQEENAFIIISGQKADAGKILYCNKQTKNILGGDDHSYLGTNITTLFLPKSEVFGDSFFRAIIEGGDTDKNTIKNLVRSYITHKDGYMIEVDYYINIHPNVTQGLHLSIIIRPVVTARDCVMVRENGEIEGMTRKMTKKLRLQKNYAGNSSNQKSQTYHVQSLSPELNKINRAYNAIHFYEKVKPNQLGRTSFTAKTKAQLSDQVDSDFWSQNEENDSISRIKKLRKLNQDSYGKTTSGHHNEETYTTIKVRDLKRPVDQSIKMDLEEAIEIFEACSGEGQEITIFPTMLREPTTLGLHYSCKVTELQNSIKIFVLDEIRKDKEADPCGVDLTYSPTLQNDHGITSLTLKNTYLVHYDHQEKFSEMSNRDKSFEFHSENFDLQEEREAHYNPTLFRSQRDTKPTYTFQTSPTHHGFDYHGKSQNINALTIENNIYPLLSPVSQGSIIMSQASLLISPERHDIPLSSPDSRMQLTMTQQLKTHTSKIRSIAKVLHVEKDTKSSKTVSQDQNGIINKRFEFAAEGSVATSHLSKLSSQRKVSRIFKSALQTPYFSRTFKVIYFTFYCLVVCIFASQVYLKFTIDSTTNVLIVKKSILINAQLRTYQLSNVQSIFRQMRDVGMGRLTKEDQGLVYRPFSEYITLSSGYLTTLIEINSEILAQLYALDENSRSTLFQKDVRVYDTFADPSENTYEEMTSFQAIDRVLQVALDELTLTATEVNNTDEEFAFISRNAINDLLLKNTDISDVFLASLQDQVDSIQMIIIIYLIIELLLLAFITSLSYYAIWRQYYKEKKLMIGFIKPSPNEVDMIIAKVHRFKKVLEKEISFEESLSAKITDHVKSSRGIDSKKLAKKEHTRAPLFAGLWKRYLLYTVRWLIYTIGLAALIIWNSVLARSSIDFSHTKVLQLDFTYRMNSRVNIGVVVASELVIPDGVSPIQDVPTTVGMVNTINDIVSLRSEIRQMLVNDDILQNSLIKTELFDNGCAYIPSNYELFCTALKDKAISNSIIELLSTFESMLTDRWNSYEASGKTDAELSAIEVTNYDMIIAVKRVILGGAQFIGDVLSQELDNHLGTVQKERNLIFGLFTAYLAVLSVIAWITLLNKLRNANNEFKRVLQVLPAEIVFTNFLLKSFLIKTSLGTLDSVKDGV